MYKRQAADDTEGTETLDAMKKRMAEEEENGTESIMKGSDGNSYMINSGKRYVEITLDYLPEGVVQVEECKYDSPDRKEMCIRDRLRIVRQLSVRETADLMRLTEAAVRKKYERAVKRARKLLMKEMMLDGE